MKPKLSEHIQVAEQIARDGGCAQGEFNARVLSIIPYLTEHFDEIASLRSKLAEAESEVEKLKACGRHAIDTGETIIGRLTEERDRLRYQLDLAKRVAIDRGAREAQLREALERIAAIPDNYYGGDWDEIEEARTRARAALTASPSDYHARIRREALNQACEIIDELWLDTFDKVNAKRAIRALGDSNANG